MLEPEAVSAILRLSELGWGSKRISRELGISRNTVKEYLAAGGWTPYQQPERKKALDGLETWLRERLRRHRGNADVLRQELAIEKAIAVSLRTVERGGEAVSAGARGGGASDGAVRDAARQADADRFWRTPGRDRRGEAARLPVCCHPRLLAPFSHQGVPQRTAGELV